MESTAILQTERLILREFIAADAAHILALLNTPGWLEFIGDRNVHTIEQAEQAIEMTYRRSYQTHGFGFWAICLKGDHTFIGMCGLVKRETLEHVDIGFAMLPDYVGQGYAYEAAQATLTYGRTVLQLPKIIGVCDPRNVASRNLLQKLGLSFEKEIQWSDGEPTLLFS